MSGSTSEKDGYAYGRAEKSGPVEEGKTQHGLPNDASFHSIVDPTAIHSQGDPTTVYNGASPISAVDGEDGSEEDTFNYSAFFSQPVLPLRYQNLDPVNPDDLRKMTMSPDMPKLLQRSRRSRSKSPVLPSSPKLRQRQYVTEQSQQSYDKFQELYEARERRKFGLYHPSLSPRRRSEGDLEYWRPKDQGKTYGYRRNQASGTLEAWVANTFEENNSASGMRQRRKNPAQKSSAPCPPEFQGVTRSIGDRTLYMMSPEQGQVFDRIMEWKRRNPDATYKDCMNALAPTHFPPTKGDPTDGLIKMIYRPLSCPYDLILKYPYVHGADAFSMQGARNDEQLNSLHGPPTAKELKHAKWRLKFETELVKHGMLIEHELALDLDQVYVKIVAPFEVLCREAQSRKIRKDLIMSTTVIPSHHIGISSRLPRFLQHLVGHGDETKLESAYFRTENLNSFVGAERGKSWADKYMYFWDISKRSWLAYNVILKCEINKRRIYNFVDDTLNITAEQRRFEKEDARVKGIGIHMLLHDKVYTSMYALHDGPKKAETQEARQLLERQGARIESLPKSRESRNVHIDPSSGKRISITDSLAQLHNREETTSTFDYPQTSPTSPYPAQSEATTSSGRLTPFNTRSPSTNLRMWLYRFWAMAWSRPQPLNYIREYFGEKTALYFAWLGFYNIWLIPVAIIGFIVFIYGLVTYLRDHKNNFNDVQTTFAGLFDNPATPWFALIMSVWTTLFLEAWKRRNAYLKWEWNVYDYERVEQPRPEYYGTVLRISPITDKFEMHYPGNLRLLRIIISGIVVIISIVIVIVSVGSLITFGAWIRNGAGLTGYWPTVVTSVVNLVVILILNMIYQKVAAYLTNYENHRTQTMFDDALILKHYLFSFVNYYSTLFYILIFKEAFGRALFGDPQLRDQCSGSCMNELTIQLAIIFVGKQFVSQAQEVLIPYLTKVYNRERESANMRKLEAQYAQNRFSDGGEQQDPTSTESMDLRRGESGTFIPQWILDDQLPAYDDSIFTEYNEMAIQYGFISLFVAAFPLAPLFALINNAVEVRSDAFKRPVGYMAQDIGMWEHILTIVSIISVLTNGAIVAFQSSYMSSVFANWFSRANINSPDFDNTFLLACRLVFFLVFEHFVLLLKWIIAYWIPNTPLFVRTAMDREEYQNQRKLRRLTGEESDTDTSEDEQEDNSFGKWWSELRKKEVSMFTNV
ncbi:hypothetical protein BZG36_04162 [Bifiguratus adelaidae]|uniref:Uncharacterized protein n=1 Tax=Bifiguratus adelaidae TaxID=1938954 RepID=A0A261XW90_9FUNG|nr:hypothetical protein BZG36_04162 [Bifiguratus adelaidae]